MITKAEIKKAILEAVGNPEAGVILEESDKIADKILALVSPPLESARESRVVKASELR